MPDVGWLATCGLLTGPRSASEASCSQARDSSPQGSLAVMADQGSLLRVPAAPASAVARTNYAAPHDDAYNYLMRPARAARFRHVTDHIAPTHGVVWCGVAGRRTVSSC